MQKYIFVCLIAVFPFAINAQNNNHEDVVYLKSGSVYHGLIIEEIPLVSITIKMYDNNAHTILLSDIKKITKHMLPSVFSEYYSENRRDRFGGFYMNCGLGYGGTTDNFGFLYTMTLGGKMFGRSNEKKSMAVGGDLFLFGGGVLGQGNGGMIGLNSGPTVVFRFPKNKGKIYITPYTGINCSIGKTQVHYNRYYEDTHTENYFNFSIPVGAKFEYSFKYLITGVNANSGASFYTLDHGIEIDGRITAFIGIKF